MTASHTIDRKLLLKAITGEGPRPLFRVDVGDITFSAYNRDGSIKPLLRKISRAPAPYDCSHGAKQYFSGLMQKEAGLPVTDEATIITPASSRTIVDTVLQSLTRGRRDVVLLPVPNWPFWEETNKDNQYGFRFMQAHDEDELVTRIKKEITSPDVAALLLAQPTSPLLYTISEQAMCEIDRMAARNGVTLLIDDIYRPRLDGPPMSSARFCTSTTAYVVEGQSKRFGGSDETIIGKITALSRLNGAAPISLEPIPDGLNVSAGIALANMDNCIRLFQEDLVRRNAALDAGLREYGIMSSRPSAHYPLTRVDIPQGSEMLVGTLLRNFGVEIGVGMAFYPSKTAPPFVPSVLRVAIGQHNPRELYTAAHLIGMSVREYKRIPASVTSSFS